LTARRYLVTGAAGFIGYHLTEALLARGDQVVGVDNLNDYYDVRLKEARLERLRGKRGFEFVRLDLAHRAETAALFHEARCPTVVHLAAQAGVRHSITHPHAYVDANLVAFVNVLEGCRHQKTEHLVYASSSSVYGLNSRMPFSVHHNVDHPVSLYAATKKANELMAHAYSYLYRIPTTGLRFFTVYGPWGRPDMAIFLFTRAILEGQPIDVFNDGRMQRDFTYIDDVVEALVRLVDRPPAPDPAWSPASPDPARSVAPYRLYNVGNHSPVGLFDLIRTIEQAVGEKAVTRMVAMQPGDVAATYADVEDLARDVGFRPATPLEVGIRRFVEWYRRFYGV
jgi:UDP-glucuronate 4-epimerase